MIQWLTLLRQALKNGERRDDRTGVGTLSVFNTQCKFDLREGFPAVTTKQLFFRSVTAELAAFLAGAETLGAFHKFGCKLWDANALAWKGARFEGDVGRIYGVNWKKWRSVSPLPNGVNLMRETDQIAQLIENLRGNPFSRRHLVITYNPGELDQVCLPACHYAFQCNVSADKQFLDLHFIMRSVDLFLGLPFDIASYALLLHLICEDIDMAPRWLSASLGDSHIYLNHEHQVNEVLQREPLSLPQLALSGPISALTFQPDQATLVNYRSHAAVQAVMNP